MKPTLFPIGPPATVLKDGVLKNQEWVSPTLNTTADGSLYFTVEDIAKWDEALERGKVPQPRRL